MDIETYYFSSVSVAATLFCILLVGWIIISVWAVFRIKRLLDKFDRLGDSTNEVVSNVSDFVRTSTQRLLSIEKAFLTAQGMKDAAHLVVTLFNNRKVKGATHDK